jgi:4-hydroxy-tetrahydrodipicolinate synthase
METTITLTAGAWPVMLTPFDAQKQIDWPAFDRLVDWYLAADIEGLFTVCFSSELFNLTPDERLQLARRTVALAGKRAKVIAAGAFGDTPEQTAAAVARLAETGVDAVVLLTNQFCKEGDSDDAWRAGCEAFLRQADPRIPLGLYECPLPYKRLLNPALMRWAAQTGRFHFFKDTCCDLAQIKVKIAAISGTSMRFYNAHTATLLPSMLAGGHGFSGCGANAIPQLYAWLCRNHAGHPETARALQEFLIASSPAVDDKYPHSVKAYLNMHGVTMTTVSRLRDNTIGPADLGRLQIFHGHVSEWEIRLGIASPFSLKSPIGQPGGQTGL